MLRTRRCFATCSPTRDSAPDSFMHLAPSLLALYSLLPLLPNSLPLLPPKLPMSQMRHSTAANFLRPFVDPACLAAPSPIHHMGSMLNCCSHIRRTTLNISTSYHIAARSLPFDHALNPSDLAHTDFGKLPPFERTK